MDQQAKTGCFKQPTNNNQQIVFKQVNVTSELRRVRSDKSISFKPVTFRLHKVVESNLY